MSANMEQRVILDEVKEFRNIAILTGDLAVTDPSDWC
jgi:hypothetical protein